MPSSEFQGTRVDFISTKDQDFHGRRIKNASDALDPQDYVTLSQLVAALIVVKAAIMPAIRGARGSSGGGSATSSLIYSATLIANTTTNVGVTGINGSKLTVKLLQDGVGGWTNNWDAANFESGCLTDIDIRVNKTTYYEFTEFSSKWHMTGYPFQKVV